MWPVQVSRFVQMVLDGDPRMVESLFLAPEPGGSVLYHGAVWKELATQGPQLLSHQVVQKYLGDATGKSGLDGVRKGKKPQKHRKMLYVAIRTLQNAMQACSGTLNVVRTPGTPNFEQVMSIRRGEGDVSGLCRQGDKLALRVRKAKDVCHLPKTAHPSALMAWLATVRVWCKAQR